MEFHICLSVTNGIQTGWDPIIQTYEKRSPSVILIGVYERYCDIVCRSPNNPA